MSFGLQEKIGTNSLPAHGLIFVVYQTIGPQRLGAALDAALSSITSSSALLPSQLRVRLVRAVQSRVVAQNKAKNSHRRTADIIREAIARREGVRTAQEEAISSVSPDDLLTPSQ